MRSLTVEDCEGCNECRYAALRGRVPRPVALRYRSLRQPDSYCAMICEFYDALGASMAASLGGAQK